MGDDFKCCWEKKVKINDFINYFNLKKKKNLKNLNLLNLLKLRAGR